MALAFEKAVPTLAAQDRELVAHLIALDVLDQHRRGQPQFVDLDAAVVLVQGGVTQFEELGTAADVIRVGVRECDHVEVVALGCLQFFLKVLLQVDPRIVVGLGHPSVAVVENDALTAGQQDLAGVPVSDGVEGDGVCCRHDCRTPIRGFTEWGSKSALALNPKECCH